MWKRKSDKLNVASDVMQLLIENKIKFEWRKDDEGMYIINTFPENLEDEELLKEMLFEKIEAKNDKQL